MKRIKILLMALIVALISIAVLNPNAIYAAEEKRDLTYQRTRPYSDDNGDNNIDDEEYTFARHKDGQEFKYSIVKIFDYNKRELETPYKKFEDSFYCIRGGKGFGSVEFGDNSSANSTKYTVIENMKSNANEVIAKYKELYNINLDRTENITFNEKTYNNVNIYNAMLWIADNAYLPVSTDKYNAQEYKTELLTKIGIAKVNQGMITDDDLEVIQQLAFWYFANYDENGKNESVSTTNPTPVNWLAINESNDVFGTRRANYLNRIYQYFIEGALKEGSDSTSTIRETTNSDSVNIEFDKNIKFGVEDKSSTGTKPNPYENYYLIGPFKITTNDARYNDFELALKDGKGNIVNQYFYFEQTEDTLKRMQIFDVINSTGNKVELEKVTYNNEYYIKLYKSAMEFVDIDCSKFSLKVSKTGKWATANFLYATGNDQAVIEIKRDKAEAEDEISTEVPKRFDLSLRKFITKLNGTELKDEKDRTPKINTSKLNTIDSTTGKKITTAEYVHPKDAVTVRKGDIVTYKIRVYNEGDRNGYATEVTDYLPEGLGFLPNYTNNSIWSIPKTTDEATGKEVLPEGIEIKNLVGENGFYKDESEINKDKIKLEDFKDPITGEVPTDYSQIQIVTGERAAISTKALKEKLIKAYKSQKADEDLWQQSTNDEKDGLFYQEVEITCIVLKENTYKGILKNVAEITEEYDENGNKIEQKGDDRDSEPKNVYEDDKHTPGKEENGYTPGEQDDDDFEQLQLKYFDLALRKFITKVDGEAPEASREPVPDVSTLIDGTYDRNGKKEHTATYNHPKDPLWVKNGSKVEYTIRVYNEGSEDGYAYEVSDDIPNGLVFEADDATNKAYGWVMYREMTKGDENIAKEDIIEYNGKKYVITTKAEEATMIRTRYLEKTLIKAFDPETKTLSYADVKVVFTIKEPKDFDKDSVIINQAQITEDSGDDEDSTPNEWQDEDDEDIEKVRIPIFDLSLLKWVTQSVVTVDGKTTTTNTGFKPNKGLTESTGEGIRNNNEPEPIAKVELDKKKLNKTVVKFVYKIRVTNEGEIPGYATEVTDYIPEGLEFHVEDGNNKQYGWVKSGDDKIVTRALETVLLNPGESKELEITFRWINSEKNLGQKINIAEISEDANDYNTDDIDSTPNNRENPYKEEQEDDDDFALVILSIKTGTTQFMSYFTLITITLAIVGGGIILIKKYVLKS